MTSCHTIYFLPLEVSECHAFRLYWTAFLPFHDTNAMHYFFRLEACLWRSAVPYLEIKKTPENKPKIIARLIFFLINAF